jgi:hypothetical protein
VVSASWVSAIAESVAALAVLAAAGTWLVKQVSQAISRAAHRAALEALRPIAENMRAGIESVTAKAAATADRNERGALIAAAINLAAVVFCLYATHRRA